MSQAEQQFRHWSGLPDGAAMDHWRFVPVDVDGDVRAVVALSGTEIHFAIDPQHRGRLITRARVAKFLTPLFDEIGFLTTRAQGHEHADFLERMGFDFTHALGGTDHYMMSAMPFPPFASRRSLCP